MLRSRRQIVGTGGLALLLAAALAIGWTGYIASDDSLYYVGAAHWISAPPFAGDNHWSTRFPLILSFAAMLRLFGAGFTAFAATALFWYAALVLVAGMFTRRIAGDRAGWIAAVLAGTMPVVIANATTVSIDLLEATLLLAGAWLLGAAGKGRAGWRDGLLAGLCFGLAVLGRETAMLSIAGLALLFLIGRPVGRDVLIACAIGIAVVLGAEALFQYALTGAPLRRYDIAFHHDSHIDRAANLEGNFLVHPAIDPLLVLLVNDDFGVIFWAAIAAMALAGRRIVGKAPGQLVVLATMAGADFLLVAVLTTKLVLNPRYFAMPALLAVIIVALWLDRATPRLRWGVVALLVLVNMAFLSVGNRHPRWEMEALVAACRAHPAETISADPVMVRRAAISLGFARLANARPLPAAPGGWQLEAAGATGPGAVGARYPSPPTFAGAVIRAVGAERMVPGALRHRLFSPSPDFVLVRTPAR